MSTGMIIDGVLGSEAIDSSGEVLDVAGADISDVGKGTLLLNWEHEPGEKGPSTIVGKVVSAKKIYSEADCENDRQKMYWKEIELPFIYGVMRLYDGAGHEEAKRIAAIIRDHVANDEMIVCRFSVEGSTLKKLDNVLRESVIRRVAVTVKPCNRTANSGLIEDPQAPPGFEKKHVKEKTKDLLDIDGETAKMEPEFQIYSRLGKSNSVVCNPVLEEAGLSKTAYEAGVASAAPSQLTGGAALQREHIGSSMRDRMLRLVAEHKDKEKFDKNEFRGLAKQALPEASDEFIDHFADMVDDHHIRRKQLSKKEEAAPAAPAAAPKMDAPKMDAPKPAALKPAKEPKLKAPKEPKIAAPTDDGEKQVKILNGTIRGVPTQPNEGVKAPHFDENTGILHTPAGSFPLYNPDKGFERVDNTAAKNPYYQDGKLHAAPGTDTKGFENGPNPGFRDIYNHHDVEEFHSGKVMPNWMRLHKLAKAGRVPDEVVMHSALFSMMSPNTPVPMHELMYAHMADTLEESGMDPRDPDFSKARENWMNRDQGKVYPKLARDYFENKKGIHLKGDSATSGRKKGEIGAFMLGENKFANVEQYHKLHQTLVDLVKKHGTDARAATRDLMDMKTKEIQHKSSFQRAHKQFSAEAKAQGLKNDHSNHLASKEAEAKAGGTLNERNAAKLRGQWRQEADALGLKDHAHEYAHAKATEKVGEFKGPIVPGLAPKTGRFTFTMLGGGNSFVPDTHIIRHLFGMDAKKDGDTLGHLKQILWTPSNHHILDGIDRWYAKNHPAAQLMQKHEKWGKDFAHPEDANFPSFWRHWCAIAGDERARGMANSASNENSTHEPFFLGINKYLPALEKHEGDLDARFVGKMIGLHAQYARDYGEVPAQMMFFHHLVPHLLEATEHREKHDDMSDFVKMAKLHALEIELKKSVEDVQKSALSDPRVPTVHAIHANINGTEHRAGRFMMLNHDVHHLEDYYGILKRFIPEGPMSMKTLSNIHGLKMAPNLRMAVEHPPEDPAADKTPDPMEPVKVKGLRPPPVFDYHRAGMDRPHTLEMHQGKAVLDGQLLPDHEAQAVLANIKTGAATLRYKKGVSSTVDQIQKMEQHFLDLLKAEHPPAQDILEYLRDLEAKGIVKAGTSDAATHHMMEDPHMTGVGNMKAFNEFQMKNKPGVHFAGDFNDFSAINNAFGHTVGDHAIKAYGSAMTDAMKESGVQGKLFRTGGDEVSGWFPSHEHAMKFSRTLHQKLDQLPPVQGVHKLSMSMGIGPTHEHADQASYIAKKNKYTPGQENSGVPMRNWSRAHKVGETPNFVHSLMPGHEGAVPTHEPGAAAIHNTLKQPAPVAAPASPAAAAA